MDQRVLALARLHLRRDLLVVRGRSKDIRVLIVILAFVVRNVVHVERFFLHGNVLTVVSHLENLRGELLLLLLVGVDLRSLVDDLLALARPLLLAADQFVVGVGVVGGLVADFTRVQNAG